MGTDLEASAINIAIIEQVRPVTRSPFEASGDGTGLKLWAYPSVSDATLEFQVFHTTHLVPSECGEVLRRNGQNGRKANPSNGSGRERHCRNISSTVREPHSVGGRINLYILSCASAVLPPALAPWSA
jgi:hypothetical protein